jgi:hypothetical protein
MTARPAILDWTYYIVKDTKRENIRLQLGNHHQNGAPIHSRNTYQLFDFLRHHLEREDFDVGLNQAARYEV